MRKNVLGLILALMMPFVSQAQSVNRHFVIEIPHVSDTTRLHVFLPDAAKATGRAVLDCPGGGYSHLSMQNEGTDWAEFFCSKGIAWVVLQYRMPKGNPRIPVSDAEGAIQMIRDSAQSWHVNPHDVGIMGFSAGGHLASTVATHAEWDVRPDFSILFYPVITMGKNGQHEGSCRNFLGEARDDEQSIRLYSNDRQVRPHLTPKSIILLANDDSGVPPVTNGVAYYTAMRRAGNECALHVYPHGGHGFGLRTTFPHHDQMLNDLTEWLSQLKSPDVNATRVACIGNSITDGHGIDMSDEKGYPAQLQKLLGKGYEVRNFGVSARTLLNEGDHPYMQELAWRDALAFNPNVVVIKLGTNDSKTENWKHKDQFLNDYQQMVDKLSALPSHPRIILAYPIKAFKDSWTINDSVITQEIIPYINKVAQQNRLETLDLYQVINDPKSVQGDGIHPNAKGVSQIAEAVAAAVRKAPNPQPVKKKTKNKKRR